MIVKPSSQLPPIDRLSTKGGRAKPLKGESDNHAETFEDLINQIDVVELSSDVLEEKDQKNPYQAPQRKSVFKASEIEIVEEDVDKALEGKKDNSLMRRKNINKFV